MKHREPRTELRATCAQRRTRPSRTVGLCAALPLLLGASCSGVAGAATWEYKVVYVSELVGITTFEEAFVALGQGLADPLQAARDQQELMSRMLNELGREGWELAAGLEKQLVFKRRARP